MFLFLCLLSKASTYKIPFPSNNIFEEKNPFPRHSNYKWYTSGRKQVAVSTSNKKNPLQTLHISGFKYALENFLTKSRSQKRGELEEDLLVKCSQVVRNISIFLKVLKSFFSRVYHVVFKVSYAIVVGNENKSGN